MTAGSDVVIAGAGPAGALAACLLARAGARVTLLDRCRFPRPKLCGDTLNPGAATLLRLHFDLSPIERRATPITGMLLTGPGPVVIRGEYSDEARGLGVTRDVLDAWLVEEAVAAGTTLVEEATVTAPLFEADGTVGGVRVRGRSGSTRAVRGRIVLAADGRRSRLGEACGLSGCAARPRRWAIGAYFEGVAGLTSLGEMHVRDGHYLGVAPTADGRANACLVQAYRQGEGRWPSPDALLGARLAADPLLGPRFATATAATRATMLGPLAIDTRVPGRAGLLLLGDAAGFIDPMTGDGIRLALTSAEVAAATASAVLNGAVQPCSAYVSYATALRARVGWKRTFNRAMRGLVSSPRSVTMAARGATLWPGVLRAAIRYAGDEIPRGAR
jgi:flavin-dependent dehydrogenase